MKMKPVQQGWPPDNASGEILPGLYNDSVPRLVALCVCVYFLEGIRIWHTSDFWSLSLCTNKIFVLQTSRFWSEIHILYSISTFQSITGNIITEKNQGFRWCSITPASVPLLKTPSHLSKPAPPDLQTQPGCGNRGKRKVINLTAWCY